MVAEYSARSKIPLTVGKIGAGSGESFSLEWYGKSLKVSGESPLATLYGLSLASCLEVGGPIRPYLQKKRPRFAKRYLYVEGPFSMEEALPFLVSGFYNGVLSKEAIAPHPLFKTEHLYESVCDFSLEDYTFTEQILLELQKSAASYFFLPEKRSFALLPLCHYAPPQTTIVLQNSAVEPWSRLERTIDSIHTPLLSLIHPDEELKEDVALLGAAVIKGNRPFSDQSLLLAGQRLYV